MSTRWTLAALTVAATMAVSRQAAAQDTSASGAGLPIHGPGLDRAQPRGTLSVRVETALTQDEIRWQSLGVFTPLVAVATTDRRRFEGVLRFVRWKVETLTGDSAVFTLAGTVN
ncbi:MAG: hypothetical protein R3A48_23175 [Polyangiales bacterium]